jgi:hypothetical protein
MNVLLKCKPNILFAAVFISIFSDMPSASSSKIPNSDSRIEGALYVVNTFGPPGFGETPKMDSKVQYLELRTQSPVSTPCGPDDLAPDDTVCPTSSKIQLHFDIGINPKSEIKAGRLVGKHVFVTGHLEHWSTSGDYTPIVMWVTSIRTVGDSVKFQ